MEQEAPEEGTDSDNKAKADSEAEQKGGIDQNTTGAKWPNRWLIIGRRLITGRQLLAGRRLDILLIVAAVFVFAFVIFGYFQKAPAVFHVNTNIYVSPRFWEIFGDTAASLVREFEEQNQDFRILPSDGENLDIVFFNDGEAVALVGSSVLRSLSAYMYTETGEDQWSLPLVSFVDLLFYNIDILQAAGNDRPPGTRDEFIAAAKSVAEVSATDEAGGDFFPFAMGLGDTSRVGIRRDFYPWVWALGAQVHSGFAADGKPTLTRQTTQAVDFLAEMNRNGLIAPGVFEKTGQEVLEQFAEGKIAMMLASSQAIAALKDSRHIINFDVTGIPAASPGRNRLGISGIYAGISTASANPDEAWQFLVFVSGKNNLLSQAIGAVPGSFFINPAKYIEEDPLYMKIWDIFEASDTVEFPITDVYEMETAETVQEMLRSAFSETGE